MILLNICMHDILHNNNIVTVPFIAEDDDPLYLAQFLINPAKGQIETMLVLCVVCIYVIPSCIVFVHVVEW